MKAQYRADIDGLRGIAVLAVVLFHAGYSSFAGGYIGVDVFFVISGYLITSLILREVQRNEFSVANFYERRVRRIFPALFLTIVITLIIGAELYTPEDFKNLGKSASAVTLFISNVQFWRESGYFALRAATKPLLHTWSLAVEEQFYLVFPLLLIAIRRFFGARFALCLTVIAAVSLALSVYGTYYHPWAAFYLSPTRGWELLLGALIACNVLRPCSNLKRNVLAAAGLALIAAGILLLTPTTPFPGIAALLPTVGAALIIYAGMDGSTFVGRALSTRPLVFIGLISYSLYLLHWPLIVFVRYFSIVELTAWQTFGLLLTTIAISAVSWRFVEQPFRSKQTLNRNQLFALAGTAMLAVGTIGLFVDIREGIPQRFNSSQLKSLDDSALTRRCDYLLPDNPQGLCTLGPDGPRPTILLWGDSHANMLATSVGQSASRQSASGFVATQGGCPPMLQWGEKSCVEFNDAIFRYIDQHPELQTVVLVARWARWSRGTQYKTEEHFKIDLFGSERPEADNANLFDLLLKGTVGKLLEMGRNVVLVEPIPEIGYSVPQAYAIASRTGRDVNELIAPSRGEYDARNQTVLATLNSLSSLKGVQIVNVSQKMCDASSCRILDSGRSLYGDDNHLSRYGAEYLSPLFDGLLTDRSVLSTHYNLQSQVMRAETP